MRSMNATVPIPALAGTLLPATSGVAAASNMPTGPTAADRPGALRTGNTRMPGIAKREQALHDIGVASQT